MSLALGPALNVTLADVKLALNKTTATDDVELQRIIDAAAAEYAEWVRPLQGTYTFTVPATAAVVLPDPNGVVVSVTQGTTLLPTTDYDVRSGVIRLVSGAPFTDRVTVTWSADAIPAHHREAIIADIAGLWEATQRGPGQAPNLGYGAPLDEVRVGRPVVLFPRTRALHRPSVA